MVGICIRRRGLKFEDGLLLLRTPLLIRSVMASEIQLVRQDLAFAVAVCPFSTDR